MENSLTDKRSYGLMDIIKFIMALLVVTIHRRPGSEDICWIYLEVNTVARFAVPFFFACSSFLFFKKNSGHNREKLKLFVLKNLRIYMIWYLIMLPGTIFKYFYSFNYSAREIVTNLVFNHFRYPIHLWFLPSLALSVAIINFITKKNEKVAAVFAVLMIAFSVMYKIYDPHLSNSYIGFVFNTLFLGLPYVFMGYYLSRHEIKLRKSVCITLTVISIAASLAWGIVDFFGFSKVVFIDNKLIYVPVVFFLMLLCIYFSPDKCFIKIRKSSMLIYYTHLVFYQEIVYIVLDILNLEKLIESRPAILSITLGYTFLITFLIITLEDKKGFKWLKKLYN